MKDPYRVLDVPRSADQAAIKQAYRKLAKALHPDRNPGSKQAEQRFREVTEAYDLLSDPAKRAKYDRGEIDASGRPRHPFRGFDFADGQQPAAASIFGRARRIARWRTSATARPRSSQADAPAQARNAVTSAIQSQGVLIAGSWRS